MGVWLFLGPRQLWPACYICECIGMADVSWSLCQDAVQNKERATPLSMMERAREAFDGNIKVRRAFTFAPQTLPDVVVRAGCDALAPQSH